VELDLSHNLWLDNSVLAAVNWGEQWNALRRLGLRGCPIKVPGGSADADEVAEAARMSLAAASPRSGQLRRALPPKPERMEQAALKKLKEVVEGIVLNSRASAWIDILI